MNIPHPAVVRGGANHFILVYFVNIVNQIAVEAILCHWLWQNLCLKVASVTFPLIKQKQLFWQAVFSCNSRYFRPHSQSRLMNVWLFVYHAFVSPLVSKHHLRVTVFVYSVNVIFSGLISYTNMSLISKNVHKKKKVVTCN